MAQMNDTVANLSEYDEMPCTVIKCLFTFTEIVAILFSTATVFIVSVTGNILIIFLILYNKSLRNTTNVHTFGLAVSDLLIAFFCMPTITIDMFIATEWIFGAFMCKFVSYVQNTAITATMLNLLAIGGQKFLAVCFPLKFPRSRHRFYTVITTGLVWLIALSESSIMLVAKKTVEFHGKVYCFEEWPNEDILVPFTIGHCVVLFFLPLFALVMIYTYTAWYLRNDMKSKSKRSPLRKSMSCSLSGAPPRANDPKSHALKLLITLMMVVAVCWSPLYILQMVAFTGLAEKIGNETLNILYSVCLLLLFFATSIHPILYGLISNKFRRAFKKTFCNNPRLALQKRCGNTTVSAMNSKKVAENTEEFITLSRM